MWVCVPNELLHRKNNILFGHFHTNPNLKQLIKYAPVGYLLVNRTAIDHVFKKGIALSKGQIYKEHEYNIPGGPLAYFHVLL